MKELKAEVKVRIIGAGNKVSLKILCFIAKLLKINLVADIEERIENKIIRKHT